VRGLVVAARYLTIVPLPGRGDARAEALGRSAAWFPVVGLGIGLAVAGAHVLGARLFPPLLAALLTVTAWKLLTGGLHLDGLADCLDGLAGRDPQHRLAIMRDSRIGAFGAVGLILFLFLEIAAVAEIAEPLRWRVLVVAPAVARALPVVVAHLCPPGRREGHGAAFQAGLSPVAVPVALAVAVAAALAGLGTAGAVALAAAGLAGLGAARFMAGRLGGVTGDVLGATVEVGELTVLLVTSAWTRARP
jgi:adenosylcobinamide-GDP ribazoletransferase